MLRYKNKKGQVGETVTWIIATLVIIGILTIFIYISSLMAQVKTVSIGNLQIGAEKNFDILSEKTNFAHQLAGNKNKDMIDNILKQDNG